MNETTPPGDLLASLTSAHQHRRFDRLLRFLAWHWAAALALVLLFFAADNLLNLNATFRAIAAATFAIANLTAAGYAYFHLWRGTLDARRTARLLERTYNIDDNSLINAIDFNTANHVADELKHYFLDRANHRCQGLPMKKLWQLRRLRQGAQALAIASLAFIAYATLFGDHARNALTRYLDPHAATTPLNYTQFHVLPGDTRVVENASCLIVARAAKLGIPATRLEILVRQPDGQTVLYPMHDQNGEARFELNRLTTPIDYRIRHRNDLSKWFRIAVVERPTLDGLTVIATPPDYAARPAVELPATDRRARLLQGSTIRVTPPNGRGLDFRFTVDGQPATSPLERVVERPQSLALTVIDRQGFVHPDLWTCALEPVPDAPPAIRFVNRELNLERGLGQQVELQLEASDDCGLRKLEIYTVVNGEERSLKLWNYRELASSRRELFFLTVAPPLFAANATYKIWCRAEDNFSPPQAATCPLPLTLHVVDLGKTAPAGQADDAYSQLFSLLSAALAEQRTTQASTASQVNLAGRNDLLARLKQRQARVHQLISQAGHKANELVADGRLENDLANAVENLKNGLSTAILRQFDELAPVADLPTRKTMLNEIALRQADLARLLQALLGEIGRRRQTDQSQPALTEAEAEKAFFDRLEQLKNELAEYTDQQKELLGQLEGIDRKQPEDWSERDEQLLGDLAARQNDLANFFKAAFNDLSKLQNQDFSNSTMAAELIEMYEELQKAGDALKSKKIEIATLAEEMGVELATSIETNIERWLADQQDSIKWNAEEGGVYPDVPIQDLPAELTDIIGDLIDNLDDMEDVEDSTNSYLGSFDEGIGWGVSDGNIDDMSAKGITGNAMPNDNEVGGRSGEGRSGKSSGQFVEETATGKGGRDTPTRLTGSPFEPGTVEDSSTDPQGGATGGGKQSGTGGTGLQGITPDQDPNLAARLPGNQIELKQRAEALVRTLTAQNLPTGDLEAAITSMEKLARQPAGAPGLDLQQVHSDMLSSLRDARTVLRATANLGADPTRRTTRQNQWSVKHQTDEPTPKGYETSIDAYFQALAQ